MPVAAKKNVSVVLFDVATSHRDRAALQTLLKISCRNLFTNSKDLTKLILLNTKDTRNRVNARSNGYKNIKEVCEDVTKHNPQKFLELIDEHKDTEEANWLEGLVVAIESLKDDYEDIGGIITYQLLFITDLKTKLGNYDKSLHGKIVGGLDKLDAFLYVVGPDIEPPFTIKKHDDVKTWMSQLNVDENDQNLTILKQIITNTHNTVVCNYKMGVHLFHSYKNWGGSQPWNVPLCIGSNINLPAQTLKILDESLPCKLSKKGGAIAPSRWIDAEDETVEIDFSEVISGIMRHEKFVQMPNNKMFQVENPRSFNVLSFTDSMNVPEYLMRGGGCYSVLPNGTPEKNEAFYVLIECLAEENKYAIARRVYNANFVPKIVALVPKPAQKCFLLTSLPYSDDIRLHYKERKVESAPRSEPKEEIYNFLDSLDNDVRRPPLGISMMLSDHSVKIVNKGADKLLDKQMGLEEIDIDLMAAPSGGVFDQLQSIWPERTLQQGVKSDIKDGSDSNDEFDWS